MDCSAFLRTEPNDPLKLPAILSVVYSTGPVLGSDTKANMTGRLAGRVAIVTGSSSGLGQAIALAFAAEGAVIFCVDFYPSERNAVNTSTGKADDFNNRIGGQGTHEKIRQMGSEATYHRADLTKARDVELAVRACVGRYGRLDIMVNNAGMWKSSDLSVRMRSPGSQEYRWKARTFAHSKSTKRAKLTTTELWPSIPKVSFLAANTPVGRCSSKSRNTRPAAGSSIRHPYKAWFHITARPATVRRKGRRLC